MEALIVIGYFIIGLVLFFSFWRWGALEGDDVGNKTMSFLFLLFWPVTIVFMVIFVAWFELVNCGKRVMKK